jgi:predicted nucleic acid-binding protein
MIALISDSRFLAISALAEFEYLSAARRLFSEEALTARDYQQLKIAFYGDLEGTFVQQPLNEGVYSEVRLLLANYRLKTLDAFQLASAIVFGRVQQERPIFVTADRSLAEAAIKEKFQTRLIG